MIKLHEIPVYALSKKELSRRFRYHKEKLKSILPNDNEEEFRWIIEGETFPQCVWVHNHVVGYIDILFSGQDVVFEVYLPYPEINRYSWLGRRKVVLRNVMTNGTHFYVDSKMDNADIQDRMVDMLDWIIKEHIPSRFYVDRNTFDTIRNSIDYLEIMNKMNEAIL